MKTDPFREYLIQAEPGRREKGYAWNTAIGLQAVDGLKPSQYLVDTAVQNIEEKITIEEAQYLVDSQVIAKLAVLVRNLEPKQGRIREEHDLWNEKWIIAHVRRTLISYGLYESGKS